MYRKLLTTSLALAFAASSALAQNVTLVLTETIVVTTGSAVYTTTSQSSYLAPTPTASASPTTYTIVVGQGGTLTFTPNNITASVGDTVEFFYDPKNHTATQSNFGNPCEPLEDSTGVVGFSSGFQPTTVNGSSPGFSLTINNSLPIWIYCAQKKTN